MVKGRGMSRYEFSFVITDVELSEAEQRKVGQAVALAGAAALGSALPANAVTAPVDMDERFRRFWVGIPAVFELPDVVLRSPATQEGEEAG
jgi:hypothetical protein